MNSKESTTNIGYKPTFNLDKALKSTASLWFVVAVLGQWLFAIYVGAFYGGAAIEGDFMKWNRVLPHGYAEGETMGNLASAIHVFLAVAILVGGPLQFIPAFRNRFRKFHRINGRIYVSLVFLVSLSGVYMVLSKGTISGLLGDVSVTINALLIFIFSILTIKKAISKKFKAHNRWAFRLFLVANGVWFFRIGLMFWLMIMGGPVGFDPETFRGPFLIFLGFGQYLLPLFIYQLYLKSKAAKPAGKFLTATLLVICTVITGIGVFAATMGMWLPRL